MPSKQNFPGKTYFENLDGLRFFCFLFVFLFHVFLTDEPGVKASPVYNFFKHTLFGNGFLGVNFFFVLSGFLITYLLIQEKTAKSNVHVPNFWVRRILRIWPLYFACIFYGFIIFPYTKMIGGGVPEETANPYYYLAFASNFDYIQKGLPDSPGLGVLWSVAIEEQFYLVWPLILFFIPVKKFWIPLLLIILGSLSFRALNDVPILHEMHTLSCIGDMAVGGLGAWLVLQSASFKDGLHHLPRPAIFLVYLAFGFVFLFRDEFLLSGYGIRIFERLITALIMIMIILEQCFANRSLFKMGNFKWISRLGLITYGLYCLHFIVISGVGGIAKFAGLGKEVWHVVLLIPVVSLVITIVAAMLSYKYFEGPFLKLKEKFAFTAKRKTPAAKNLQI